MTELIRRKNVDLLVEQFWRKGYLTLSRKFGTYLPEPTLVGGFEVDVIARQKNNYALGLTITAEDLTNQTNFLNKVKYLASRKTRQGNQSVMLFIGVKEQNLKAAKSMIDQIDTEIKKNIKLVLIQEHFFSPKHSMETRQQTLFS